MSKSAGAFALIVFLLSLSPVYGADEGVSIVPGGGEISDEKALYGYIESLSMVDQTIDEALHQYEKIVRKFPQKPLYLLGMGQLLVRMDRFEEALSLLKTIELLSLTDKEKIEKAQFLIALGYAKQADQEFLRLLAKERDQETLKQYSYSMRSWGDFDRSKELEEELHNKVGIIESLIGAGRYMEAEALSKAEIEEGAKKKITFYEEWILSLHRRRAYEEELTVIEQAEKEKDFPQRLYLDKAEALSKLGRVEEAVRIWEKLRHSEGLGQEALIAEAKALLKQGDLQEAADLLQEAKKTALSPVEVELYLQEANGEEISQERILEKERTAQGLLLYGNYFQDKGDEKSALQIAEKANEIDPAHFPSLLRQAELTSSAFDYPRSISIYESILDLFPDNSEALYGIARVRSWNKEYDTSIEVYDYLLEIDPTDLLARIERARVFFWGKEYRESLEAYDELLAILESSPLPYQALRRMVVLEKMQFAFEWNRYIIETLKVVRCLATENPWSDYYKFEYGQALCSVGLCDEAQEAYQDIIKDVPLHVLAKFALEREQVREKIEAGFSYNYWNEIGFGDLSQVGRYEVDYSITYPISCRQKVGYIQRRWIEHTFYDGHYHPANGQSLVWENRFSPYTSVQASVTHKQYLNEFRPTYTGFGQFNFQLRRAVDCLVGYKRTDEIYNYFNLAQTTQANIFWGTAHCFFTHNTEGSFLGEFIEYNDKNDQVHCVAELAHSFTEHPNVFKMKIGTEYRNTKHTNIFIYNAVGDLVDIIFPYWAPQHYWFGQLQFEWRRDYGFFEFCNSPERYYDLKFACGDDNIDDPFWEVKGEWHHEFNSGWKFTLAGYLHGSPQWRAKGFWCSLGMKF